MGKFLIPNLAKIFKTMFRSKLWETFGKDITGLLIKYQKVN